MKNKIIGILIIFTLFTLFSCDEKLEQTPYDGLTDDQVFANVEGFESAMKGVYSSFKGDGLYGESGGLQINPDVFSDNLIYVPSGRHTQRALFELRNTAIDESFSLYQRGYITISRANRILQNIDNIKDEAIKTQFIAEARAIRGMMHFDIARTYCKIPTQSADANSSLGIAYMKEYIPNITPRRVGTTVEETYKQIIEDLEYGAANVSDKGKDRITKNAINAVLSRVYLYMGNYNKVIEVADRIPSNITIAPMSEFLKIWTDEYFDNVLFYVKITSQDNHAIGNPYSQTSDEGIKSEFAVSYPLYKLYKDIDVRKSVYIYSEDFAGNTYNHVSKYFGNPQGTQNVTNGKYIRMEEVILNKAEAYAKKGQNTEALKLLNLLRKERYDAYTDGTEAGTDLMEAIQLERRLELAFEGDRYYQLKRLGKDMERGNFGEFSDGKGTPAVAQTLKAGDYRWQQPIPQGAFDNNPELTKEDQNPEY